MLDWRDDEELAETLGYGVSALARGQSGTGRRYVSNYRGRISHKPTRSDLIREGRMITDPKELLLTVMRGGDEARAITSRQIDAAKAVLPYVAPRLASTEVRIKQPFGDWSVEELERAAAHLESVGTGQVLTIDGRAEKEGE